MDELVINGGAEDGLNGWTVSEGIGGSINVVSSPTPIEGTSIFEFRSVLSQGSGANHMSQFFATVPGSTYEGSISYNGVDGDPGAGGNNFVITLSLDLEGLGFATTLHQVNWNAETGWHSRSFTFVALTALTGIKVSAQASVPTPVLNTVRFYADGLSVPAIVEPAVLGLRPVSFGELLDTIQFDAGDFSSNYRNNARHWLNLVRSYISGQGFWRAALRGNGSISISGSETSGIYSLKDAASPTPQVWAFVEGNQIWNVTDNRSMSYIDPATIGQADPNLDQTGTPYYWTDKGYNDAGEPQIMLFPRPTQATTLNASLYKQYEAIDENLDAETIDPFFGPIDDWAHTFLEGLRYYKEQDENEVGTQQQWARFVQWVEERRRKQGIPSVVSHRMRNLRWDIARIEPDDAIVNPLLLGQ